MLQSQRLVVEVKVLNNIIFLTLISHIFLIGCSGTDIDVEGVPAPNLRSWLSTHDTIRTSIKLEDDANPSYWYGGSLTELEYDNWSETDKNLLDSSFERAWSWLYQSGETSILGTEEFGMPLSCTFCESSLVSNPTGNPFLMIPESLAKTPYISYVAFSLALEIGSKLSWSIASSSSSELHHYFNSRSIMHRVGAYNDGAFFFGSPGGAGDVRNKYLGNISPATPIYAYRWFVNNALLKTTHEATIYAVLEWFRNNAVHFYGAYTIENMDAHWGYPAQASAYHIMTGTVRDTESSARHWTAGCHGTAGFIKSVMKAVNIPVEILYVCGHAQLYFPTIDKYIDHGDDPYNANVRTQPSKNISGIFIDATTHQSWFTATPDFLPTGSPECTNIGKAAQDF